MNPIRRSLAIGALFVAATIQAHAVEARPEDATFQTRVFGHVMGATEIHACFSRTYDAGHLASHQNQKVRTVRMLVTSTNGGYDGSPQYQLAMGVTFRRSGTHFVASGGCGSIHDQMTPGQNGMVAHCGIDCDGGIITVSLKDDRSVLVAIPHGASTSSPHGDNDGPRFGTDDRLFRLDKTPLADCLSLAADPDTKRAMRRGQ